MTVSTDVSKTGVFGLTSSQAAGIMVRGGLSEPFTRMAVSHAVSSVASSRAAYEDSTALAFDERWTNLTAWTLPGTPGMQVSAGALYSVGTQGAGSGANRSYALASTDTLRAVFVVNHNVAGSSGGLVVGVSDDAAGAVPASAAGNAFGLFFRAASTTMQSVDHGVFTDVVTDGGTAQPLGATAQYLVTVTVDATYISVVAVRVSNGDEIRTRRLRAGMTVSNLYIFNSDTRALTGISVGPVGGRKSVSSVLPLATYETVVEKAHWSGDGTQNFKLHVPKAFDSRKPMPLVIMFHGAGASENQWTSNSSGKAVKDVLVAAGYAVLGYTYAANSTTWGAQASLDACLAAYNWARGLYPIGPVALYSSSMGGIESLLILAARTIPGIVAWVGSSSTTNLADNYTGNGGGFTANINTAYSISGGNYVTQTAGHDPMLLDASLFRGVPMLFFAATDDVVVLKTTNTDAFATKVANYNTTTVQAGITGGHGFGLSPYAAQIATFIGLAFNS